MHNKQFTDGMLLFAMALLFLGVSSFLGHFPIPGDATNLAQGFLDGLPIVACGTAIALLARSRRRA